MLTAAVHAPAARAAPCPTPVGCPYGRRPSRHPRAPRLPAQRHRPFRMSSGRTPASCSPFSPAYRGISAAPTSVHIAKTTRSHTSRSPKLATSKANQIAHTARDTMMTVATGPTGGLCTSSRAVTIAAANGVPPKGTTLAPTHGAGIRGRSAAMPQMRAFIRRSQRPAVQFQCLSTNPPGRQPPLSSLNWPRNSSARRSPRRGPLPISISTS